MGLFLRPKCGTAIVGEELSHDQVNILSEAFGINITVGASEMKNGYCTGPKVYLCDNPEEVVKFLRMYGDFSIETNVACICGDIEYYEFEFEFPGDLEKLISDFKK